jgi:DNA-binding transcriptional MerR regulator
MHVNELARESGVAPHVVRYYTQMGLLQPRRDPKNRYREYAEPDVYRLRFIRRAKRLGFTLRDVKAILHDVDHGVAPCPDVRKLIRVRASENRDRLRELKRLQQRVEEAIALWDTMPDRPPDHKSLCHLIDAVATAKGGLT